MTEPNFESLYESAFAFAKKKHAGQLRIDGLPYITHPQAVAEDFPFGREKIAAILHDVLEDTDATEADLIRLGVDEPTRAALRLLTHDWNEKTYEQYVADIALNPIAKAVKRADLAHNLATIDTVEEPKRSRLLERYIKARAFLEQNP